MKNAVRAAAGCMLLLLAGCFTTPWKDSVGLSKDTTLTLAGVDHMNALTMDTTGAALVLNQKQPNGAETTTVLNNSIVHQRGLIGVAIEQAAGPFTGGWFYVAGQRVRRPAQISVGNVTGASSQGSSATSTSNGGSTGVGITNTASTGGIGVNANANAQQSQGQGQQQGQGQGQSVPGSSCGAFSGSC